jgi:Eukaryotic aspartyl protease
MAGFLFVFSFVLHGSSSDHSAPSKISNFSLAGYTAAFSSTYPFIALPEEIAEEIIATIGADGGNLIDCDLRDSLPSLVINLALGEDYVSFVLSPYDYIRRAPKFEFFSHKKKCQVCLAMLHPETSDAKFIILGSVFLARWYTVFDYDNTTISCKLSLC